ncbi:MAG: ParA family protein [Deltaproteobacteria bacterium]|nr:ParA family protein [Deltaproteobacteria bacterium]
MVAVLNYVCSVCGKSFALSNPEQVRKAGGETKYFCSRTCVEAGLNGAQVKTCSRCGGSFPLIYVYQEQLLRGGYRYFCSRECRSAEIAPLIGSGKKTARISVLNHKGGTGKTTTVVSLAFGLKNAGKSVLIIDFDSQGSAASSLGTAVRHSLTEVITKNLSPAEYASRVEENIAVIPSSEELFSLEIAFASDQAKMKSAARMLRGINDFDFVLIDCAPSITLLNRCALLASDYVIIPVSCDFLSVAGVKQILKTLRALEIEAFHSVKVLGILPTFYDARTRASRDVMDVLNRYFKERIFEPIRVNTLLKEAPSRGKSIYDFAPASRGAEDYARFAAKVLELLN